MAQSRWMSWAQIIVGLVLSSSAYKMFLIPCEIAAGGFTGIGQLINSFTGWPVGTIALCLNIPLFAVSMRQLGLTFGLRSLFASIALSFLIDYLPLPAVTTDAMLATLYGGVLGGIGFGLILRGNATTGGSDMLGKLINTHIPVMRVGAVTFIVDGLVILFSAFVFDTQKAMLALIAAYLMNKLLDMMLEGLNTAKAYYIISSENQAIATRILNEMERGVTRLDGVGMYSGEPRSVLLCVIGRLETIQLRNIVAETDPRAFMIATNVHEALGEGFKPHNNQRKPEDKK